MMAVCHAGSITTYRFTEMACTRDRHGRLCWLCAIANTPPPPCRSCAFAMHPWRVPIRGNVYFH